MKLFRRILILFTVLILCYITVKLLKGTGRTIASHRHVESIEDAGISLDEMAIPSDVRVVGLGEAACGSAEFQAAKLEVLKKMIADGGCRAITFDIPVGEGAMINSAIHGNGAHLTELVSELGRPYYDTQQIIDLLAWMREFNKGRSYDNSVMFYGIDMQDAYSSIKYLCEFGEVHPEAFKEGELEKITLLAEAGSDTDLTGEKEFFQNLYDHLSRSTNTDYMIASLAANSVLQSLVSFYMDEEQYIEYRSACLALNVQTVSGIEEHRGYSRILVTAHNSEIAKSAPESDTHTTMGQRINDLYAGNYFAIGTEFYNAVVNVHIAGTYDEAYERKDHRFCSLDILAYQASLFEDGKYVLVFDDVTEEQSKLYKIIHEENFVGVVPDEYSVSVDLRKSYRLNIKATDSYDAMIYYYETSPIKCLH